MKTSENRPIVLTGYAAMVAAAVSLYLFIRFHGMDLRPGVTVATRTGDVKGIPLDVLANVLVALAVITLAARGLGSVFRRHLGQPPVIGEIVAGIALGPSLLGAIAPSVYSHLLPAAAAPFVGMIAKVGVVLFMFLVGLDLDIKLVRESGHATLVISHASIIAPFLLGAALSLWLYPRYATQGVGFTVFSLFIGVSMSVTAFPVLARILTDRGVQKTRLGALALACAAVDDVTAWTLLAFVAGVATAKAAGVTWTIVFSACFVAVVVVFVRPLLRRLAAREDQIQGPLSQNILAVVFVSLLVAGAATEFIGIHALFGSFLLGAVMPPEGRLADQLRGRMGDIVVVLFLPAFFAFTGMRTQIGLLSGATDWLACAAIIGVATLGKFGGSLGAGRLVGMGWRESSAIGILMNTRGLMELIVLNLGLEMGVISPTVFAMLIIMALVTTFSTTPVLNLIMGQRGFADAPPPSLVARNTQSASPV